MGIPKPNYTQVPNVLLDDMMKDMKEAELRVVLAICRQTFGWHRKSKKMSLSYLADATGMTSKGVIGGIKDGIERGIINKKKDRDSWRYNLVIADALLVTQGDTLATQLVTQGDTLLVTQGDTKKERDKEREKSSLPLVGKEREERESQTRAIQNRKPIGFDEK